MTPEPRPLSESQQAAHKAQRQQLEDFYAVFSTEPGQRVLAWIRGVSFQHKTIFEAPKLGAPVDPKLSDRNEGRRILGLEILNRYELSTKVRSLETQGGRVQGTLTHEGRSA